MIEGIMTIKHSNLIHKPIVWAKGRKQSEQRNYTWWSSSKDCARLGGVTISNCPKYVDSDVDGSVKITAHTRDGKSYWKHLDIPLDKIDEFCQAVIEVRDFALSQRDNKNNN